MIDRIPVQVLSSDVFASATLIATLLLARLLFGRALKGRENLTPAAVRRWTANMRNFLLLVGIIGLVMIWAPQLRTFALSLTAVAVALVVATKELILCLSGSALRTFTRAYSVGDYVEIGTTRGEVLDYNLVATKLREFEGREGSFVPTGREVLVPHSLLFASPIRVDGEAGARVCHRFMLTFEPDADLFAAHASIEQAAKEAMSRFDEADGESSGKGRRRSKASSVPEVEIDFGTSDIGKIRLEISVYARPEAVQQAENAIAVAVGSHVHSLTEAARAGVERPSS